MAFEFLEDIDYGTGHKVPSERIKLVVKTIRDSGRRGLTAHEVGCILWPGQERAAAWAGACVTPARKEFKLIVALAETRGDVGKSHVYVAPEHVDDRPVWEGTKGHHCQPCYCFPEED